MTAERMRKALAVVLDLAERVLVSDWKGHEDGELGLAITCVTTASEFYVKDLGDLAAAVAGIRKEMGAVDPYEEIRRLRMALQNIRVYESDRVECHDPNCSCAERQAIQALVIDPTGSGIL